MKVSKIDDLLGRAHDQIVQNELANITELTIRIIKPNAPKVFYDYHTKKAELQENNADSQYTLGFVNYESFLSWLSEWNFNEYKAIEITKSFSSSKPVPREIFWHTYFSRQPLYLSRIRNHYAKGPLIKSYYQLFIVKKIIELNNSKKNHLVFFDCWGLICYLSNLYFYNKDNLDQPNCSYLLCGFRPGKSRNFNINIQELINNIPFDISIQESGIKNLVEQLRGIEPSEDIENEPDNRNLTIDHYRAYIQKYGNTIKTTFRRINKNIINLKNLKKEELISLTQLYSFYEFRRQKEYLLQVYKTLRSFNANNLIIQSIQGINVSSGKNIHLITTFFPNVKITDLHIRFQFLSSISSFDDLKGKVFLNTYSDNKFNFGIRFLNNQLDLESPPLRYFKTDAMNLDLIAFGEQIGVSLNNALNRFIRRSESYRISWENEKIFALDKELSHEISDQFSKEGYIVSEYRELLMKSMYNRMINRAARIIGGQRCCYLSVDYTNRRLIFEESDDVYFSEAFSSLEKRRIKSIDINSDVFRNNICSKVIFQRNEICLNESSKESHKNCSLLGVLNEDILSCICIPILSNNRTLGIIHIDGFIPHLFDEKDKEKMNNFSASISTYLQHQFALYSLNQLHLLALEKTEINTKIEKIVKVICQATLSDFASLWLWYPNEEKLKLHTSIGYKLVDHDADDKKAFCYLNEGICGKVIVDNNLISIENIESLSDKEIKYREQLFNSGVRSILSYPLSLPPTKDIIGAINIMNRDITYYNHSIRHYFKVLVDQLSMVIFKILFELTKLQAKIAHESQNMLLNISSQTIRLSKLFDNVLLKKLHRAESELIRIKNLVDGEKFKREELLPLVNNTIKSLNNFPLANIRKAIRDVSDLSDLAKTKIADIAKQSDLEYVEKNIIDFGKSYPALPYYIEQEYVSLSELIRTILNRNKQQFNNSKRQLNPTGLPWPQRPLPYGRTIVSLRR